MTTPVNDSIFMVEAFIQEKLETARPGDTRPRIPPELSQSEARWLLEAVRPHGDERPLLEVTAEGKQRSDRFPRLRGGGDRRYGFVSENPTHDHETVVQWSAIARLRYHFSWPRAHLICESPRIEDEARVLLKQDAVDILLLEQPCAVCAWRMPVDALGTRVVAEVKRNATLVDKLIREMQSACRSTTRGINILNTTNASRSRHCDPCSSSPLRLARTGASSTSQNTTDARRSARS